MEVLVLERKIYDQVIQRVFILRPMILNNIKKDSMIIQKGNM